MEKAEIDNARAQAVQVAAVLSPLLQALQSAGEILSMASNVSKHTAALTDEVASLKNQAIAMKEAVDALALRKMELTAEVQAAEANARERARTMAQALEDTVKEAEAAAAVRTSAAATAAAVKEAEFTQHILAVQSATDQEVAALFTKRQTAAEAAAAAEKRLADIQAQAQKFAAALGG